MVAFSKMVNSLGDAMIFSSQSLIKEDGDGGYYFFYVRTGEVKRVSKRAFKSSNAKFYAIGGNAFRLVGLDSNFRFFKQKLDASFSAESLFSSTVESFSQIASGFSTICTFLKAFGSIPNKSMIVIDILKILVSLISGFSAELTVGNFISSLLEVYIFYTRYLTNSFNSENFIPESFEALSLAGLSLFLPKELFEIFRRASLFTTSKILDDSNSFYSLFKIVIDFIQYIISLVPIPEALKPIVNSFLNLCSFSSHHMLVKRMEKFVLQHRKNPHFLVDPLMRAGVQELDAQVNENLGISEWTRRSATLQEIYKDFKRICKICISYGSSSRVEPTAFIFSGPPGCLKSFTMNQLIAAMPKTSYSHAIKAMMDGKDWYDSYNNEEIFYMDDVGQQGISQWRSLINMVSGVRLPLDCADASLKDTKFFNSEIIMLTTNCFEHLQGLTKDDCISDIKALWRRGYVFDFSRVTNYHGSLLGTIQFKHFCIKQDKWISDFPQVFHDKLRDKKLQISSACVVEKGHDRSSYLGWFARIIAIFLEIKKSQHTDSALTESEKNYIKDFFNEDPDFEDAPLPPADLDSDIDQPDYIRKLNQKIVKMSPFVPNGFVTDVIQSAAASVTGKLEPVVKFWEWKWWQEIIGDLYSNIFSYIISLFSTSNGKISLVFITSVLIAIIFGKLFTILNNFLFNSTKKFEDKVNSFLPSDSPYKYQFVKGHYNRSGDFVPEVNIYHLFNKPKHSSIEFVSKAVKPMVLQTSHGEVRGTCMLSGHCVVFPSHFTVDEDAIVTVFNDDENKHVIIDHAFVKRVYNNLKDDLCVFALNENFPTPFKNLSHFLKPDTILDRRAGDLHLIGPGKAISIPSIQAHDKSVTTVYFSNHMEKYLLNKDKEVYYQLHGKGLCGTVLFEPTVGIKGMHVAGHNETGIGASMVWSNDTIKDLKTILGNDNKNTLAWDMSPKILEEKSVIKLDFNPHTSVPKNTNFSPSPLFEIYPIDREPANLQVFGPHTVKDVAKKSFQPCQSLSSEEIQFAKKMLSNYFTDFSDLPENEVVSGNEFLAGMNKDSSNGYHCEKLKSSYFDFARSSYTELMRSEISQMEINLQNGTPDYQKLIWCETLKDEIRNEEKQGVPRSFRISTVHVQVLTKKYFGKMVEHILKNRKHNQIMIGVNPYLEWGEIYDSIKNLNVFAGDFGKFDGKMLSVVQQLVVEVLLQFYKGQRPKCAAQILHTLINTIVAIMDDTFLTTHSLPSGSFLTAIFNSFVNRVYTFVWYYRACKRANVTPSFSHFHNNIVDYVYGDDKLVGVSNAMSTQCNAISMKDFCDSIGLDYTDSKKNPVTKPFDDLESVTFLKRSFRYHPLLQKIMCPLEFRTLCNGLSWVDNTKDCHTVMQDKVHSFQRELYLHPEWHTMFMDFKSRIKNFPFFNFVELSESYLYQLYSNVEDMEYIHSLNKGTKAYS